MNVKVYDKIIDVLSEKFMSSQSDEDWEALYTAQDQFMQAFCDELSENADTKAKRCICEAVQYAITNSLSGNAIVYTDEKTAAEVEDIIWDMIGDMLLDVQIYKDNAGDWAVDVMFGGHYVPGWDGWSEMAQERAVENRPEKKVVIDLSDACEETFLWLSKLFANEADEAEGAAANERCFAKGSDGESVWQHENNAAMNTAYAELLKRARADVEKCMAS